VLYVVILIVLGLAGSWFWRQTRPHVVPKAIAAGVNFPIFYPLQSKLPVGYTLNRNSFKRPIQNGVTYTVSNSMGQQLVFSLQQKPSANDLQNFQTNYIPLHNIFLTSNGQALLGAYNTKTNTETLVSLPIDNANTWIVLTAPYNINQSQLHQVLNSLQRN
jgi:hypothetical protein